MFYSVYTHELATNTVIWRLAAVTGVKNHHTQVNVIPNRRSLSADNMLSFFFNDVDN